MFDIDPAVTAGFINDRYDLLVRGRVVANQPVESVTLLRDGAVVSYVGFGTTAKLVRRQHAFHVNIPLGRKDATRHCQCLSCRKTHKR